MAKKLVLRSKEDVRMAIRKRAAEIAANMSDREFFLSEAFIKYATQLTDFILRKHRLYSMSIQYDDSDDAITAYTDGKKIVVNAGHKLPRNAKLLERRFKTVMGMAFHEAAHKLFLDFSTMGRALDKIQDGKLYGKFPTQGIAELEKAKQELETVTASPYAGAIAKLYQHFNNVIADGHDERCMQNVFKGFISDCITVVNEEMAQTSPKINELIDTRQDAFSICSMLLLEYTKFGYYVIGDVTPEVQKHLDFMAEIEPTVDMAVSIDSLKERWDYINLLMLQFWPLLREKFPDNPQSQPQSGQGSGNGSFQGVGGSGGSGASGGQQGGQGGNTPSPEEVQNALEQILKEVEKALNNAPAPQNCSGKAVDPSQVQTGGADPGAQSSANQIAQDAAQGQARTDVQSELDKAQMDAIRNTNLPLVHKHVDMEITRHNSPNKQRYQQIAKEIDPIVRNLVKEMLLLLREMNEEMVQHHKRIGPMVEATEAYRPDRAFFAKKKLPADLPNMALCVLIDQSGSMGGEKIECARKTAILLERFAHDIGIPLMVAGHCVLDGVEMQIYTDYLSACEEEDRYSLANILPGGCNRDGLPIRMCCEMLASRPEDVKLMIVISDGAPNDTGYRGKEAREDISKTVQEFRRKNLLIYGAAIDDDKDVIQEIYGKGFLSIENLNLLPKTLVRLVRQQIC